MSIRTFFCVVATTVAATGLAAAPAHATRAALSPDGRFLEITESSPGEVNHLLASLHRLDGHQYIDLIDNGPVEAGPGCAYDAQFGKTRCVDPDEQVRVSLGGGDDRFQPTEIGTTVTFGEGALAVDLGDGADTYDAESTNAMALVHGGAGNDTLLGSINADHLHGDDGDDKLDSGKGADELRGGAGMDTLKGDHPSDHGIYADVLDGGDGNDLLDDYVYSGDPTHAPPVTITLDGQANDGRQDEGDNVLAVERIKSGSAGSFTGDDQTNEFAAPEVGPPGTLLGNGGDDVLIAGDAHGDTVDGGAGADLVEGGFGDDRLVGGPGRDTVNGDRKSRCNEYSCDVFVAGNDTIEVRDGEVDSVTCGTGADRVTADHDDVVAADCETVDRAPQRGGPGDPDGPGPKGDGPKGDGPKGDGPAQGGKVRLTIRGVRLARALRLGLPVQVSGATGTVRLRALRGAKVVATGSARARNGKATVRLRFTKAARRSLARKRSVTLRITGAGTPRTIRLKG